MLVDPRFILGHAGQVAAAIAVIVIAKGLVSAGVARLLGRPIRVAVLVGALLAQSTELSFLLARVGVDLGVLSAEQVHRDAVGATRSREGA